MSVAVVCGGVGAARLLRGIVDVVDARTVAAVVNTGDDTVMHGLTICPDLDTITYTLAGAIDADRGWGLAGETWAAMEALARYGTVRPPMSGAAATWFGLGDRDLATHLYRTARLAEGASLTTVTAEIAAAWGLELSMLPMTDGEARTMVQLATSGDEAGVEVSFQDYFVRLRHDVAVESVRFDHVDADLTAPARAALADADRVVIAPSNPIVSIGPVRALTGVDELLAARRGSVVAVSPIVGGTALKGPADRMMRELGIPATVVGVAELYAPIAGALIVDPVDAGDAAAIERHGIECIVQPSIMSNREVTAALARAALAITGR